MSWGDINYITNGMISWFDEDSKIELLDICRCDHNILKQANLQYL